MENSQEVKSTQPADGMNAFEFVFRLALVLILGVAGFIYSSEKALHEWPRFVSITIEVLLGFGQVVGYVAVILAICLFPNSWKWVDSVMKNK